MADLARDRVYAEALLKIAQTDADRAARAPEAAAKRSVALWMAHEVSRQAEILDIPESLATSMRHTAHAIRQRLERRGHGAASI